MNTDINKTYTAVTQYSTNKKGSDKSEPLSLHDRVLV